MYDSEINSITAYLESKNLEAHEKYLICKELKDSFYDEWVTNDEEDLEYFEDDDIEDDTDDAGNKRSSDAGTTEEIPEDN